MFNSRLLVLCEIRHSVSTKGLTRRQQTVVSNTHSKIGCSPLPPALSKDVPDCGSSADSTMIFSSTWEFAQKSLETPLCPKPQMVLENPGICPESPRRFLGNSSEMPQESAQKPQEFSQSPQNPLNSQGIREECLSRNQPPELLECAHKKHARAKQTSSKQALLGLIH